MQCNCNNAQSVSNLETTAASLVGYIQLTKMKPCLLLAKISKKFESMFV